jgi:hypothetical protein
MPSFQARRFEESRGDLKKRLALCCSRTSNGLPASAHPELIIDNSLLVLERAREAAISGPESLWLQLRTLTCSIQVIRKIEVVAIAKSLTPEVSWETYSHSFCFPALSPQGLQIDPENFQAVPTICPPRI